MIAIQIMIAIITAVLLFGCATPNEPAVSHRYAWIVGDKDSTGYGAIYFSRDGGVTLERQGLGQEALKDINVLDVKAIDARTVWAVCSNNRIIKTTNAGQLWQQVQAPSNDPLCELYCISSVASGSIYISGSHSTVYVSNDAGSTWSKREVAGMVDAQFQGVVALSDKRAYICGNVPVSDTQRIGVIRQTTDGGLTWSAVALQSGFDTNHRWISAATLGSSTIIYGETNYYSVSNDDGRTWRNDSTRVFGGGGGADINHLIMLNERTWMAALDMGHLLRTDDAGATWNDVRPGLGATFMLGIDAFDNDFAVACGETSNFPQLGHIVYTTDGGTTWTRSFTKTGPFRKVSTIR
jgi:photosystem II stability/assembly factor-like uncharacterized protein